MDLVLNVIQGHKSLLETIEEEEEEEEEELVPSASEEIPEELCQETPEGDSEQTAQISANHEETGHKTSDLEEEYPRDSEPSIEVDDAKDIRRALFALNFETDGDDGSDEIGE